MLYPYSEEAPRWVRNAAERYWEHKKLKRIRSPALQVRELPAYGGRYVGAAIVSSSKRQRSTDLQCGRRIVDSSAICRAEESACRHNTHPI